MPLPVGLHDGRLVAHADGRGVYSVDCCKAAAGSLGSGQSAERRKMRLISHAAGRGLYAFGRKCPTSRGSAGSASAPSGGSRYLSRLLSHVADRPLFALVECQEAALGSVGSAGSVSSGLTSGLSSGLEPILTDCCPDDPIPQILRMTITDPTASCPCLAGFLGTPLALTYQTFGISTGWILILDVPCGPHEKLMFFLRCVFSGGWQWIFTIHALEDVFGIPSYVQATAAGGVAVSCNPLELSADCFFFADQGYTGDYCPLGSTVFVNIVP